MRPVPYIGVTALVLLGIAMLFTPDWDRPPVDSVQIGYRGTSMEQIVNPRRLAEHQAANVAPGEIYELSTGGDLARDVYENVPVLGHLPDEQFTRLMAAITEWVAPQEGCAYCHNLDNLASDELYTKVVSRRMIQMTQHVNEKWSQHVGGAGVTCYTCHRGNHVPEYIWTTDEASASAPGFTPVLYGQNRPNPNVGMTSMEANPFSETILAKEAIRVQSQAALPGQTIESMQTTERTYGLMMHMSESLGVGCVFCHNSARFANWTESTPQRVTAWHGLEMVRSVNGEFLAPLNSALPANRLGPDGDAPKAFCATCHQGAPKPLYGADMISAYPSLSKAGPR